MQIVNCSYERRIKINNLVTKEQNESARISHRKLLKTSFFVYIRWACVVSTILSFHIAFVMIWWFFFIFVEFQRRLNKQQIINMNMKHMVGESERKEHVIKENEKKNERREAKKKHYNHSFMIFVYAFYREKLLLPYA